MSEIKMKSVLFDIGGLSYEAHLGKGYDLSIPLLRTADQVNCFYAPPYRAEPVVAGDFIGSTQSGGPVNFFNLHLNPHGNGTHTECVGHIAREAFAINDCLKTFHFTAELVSLYPRQRENGDKVVEVEQFMALFEARPLQTEALILRTLPNDRSKLHRSYSGTNPPYLSEEVMDYLVDAGIRHLLLDLPSVDREEDGGLLAAHKAFWRYPDTVIAGRLDCTITELIYVDDEVPDGFYLLNLQIISLDLDASPSKVMIYPCRQVLA